MKMKNLYKILFVILFIVSCSKEPSNKNSEEDNNDLPEWQSTMSVSFIEDGRKEPVLIRRVKIQRKGAIYSGDNSYKDIVIDQVIDKEYTLDKGFVFMPGDIVYSHSGFEFIVQTDDQIVGRVKIGKNSKVIFKNILASNPLLYVEEGQVTLSLFSKEVGSKSYYIFSVETPELLYSIIENENVSSLISVKKYRYSKYNNTFLLQSKGKSRVIKKDSEMIIESNQQIIVKENTDLNKEVKKINDKIISKYREAFIFHEDML